MKIRFLVLFLMAVLVQVFSQETIEIDEAQKSKILEAHNAFRRPLKLSQLTWNEELSELAENWAMTLAKKDKSIHHRPDNEFGENIAYFSYEDDLSYGVSLWTDEKKDFEYKPIGDDYAIAGHYTQVIWKNTTEVGCGCAKGKSGYTYFVCNYNPHGNVIGQKPYK
jgi:uncharacterized protein YkwD